MKKLILYALLIAGCIGCSDDYDDSKLWDSVNRLENRVAKLEELCNRTNTNLIALQEIVTVLQNKDYITDVSPLLENGEIIGYTIKFAKNNPIVIYNGKDGADGIDGNTPVIGVKKDTDGIYYWTLDGEFIVVDGQKIKAQGTDGNNGADGSDGVTPKLEIREDYWYISYDNGTNWTQLGKATGADGKDANSIKITQDENNVYFELVDGTIITISKTGKVIDAKIIQFEDENAKKICVAIWDTDNDHELSLEEASAVTSLGDVFKNTNNVQLFNELKYFTGLTSLEPNAFNGCSKLWRITIPKNVETLDPDTFVGCSQLKRVMFDKGSKVKIIPSYLFHSSKCPSLTAIEIPASVEIIENGAFYMAESLTMVTFEKGSKLKAIGTEKRSTDAGGVFYQCISLNSIEIPSSVETIGWSAFVHCSSLSTITFEEGAKLKAMLPGAVGYCYSLNSIKIPASVETIGLEAFCNCSSLATISFERGSALKTIDKRAFYEATHLITVDMSACTRVESIGEKAFYQDFDLQLLKIGAQIPPTCGQSVFSGINGNSILQVPSGSENAYKRTNGWYDYFSSIEAIK